MDNETFDSYSFFRNAEIKKLEKYTKTLTKRFKDIEFLCHSVTIEHHTAFNFHLDGLMRTVKSLYDSDPKVKEHFEEFENDKLLYDPESNDHMRISYIYIEYKEWYKDNHGSIVGLRPLRDLKDFLDKKYSYHYPTGYKGLSFIIEEPLLIDSNLDFVEDE